MPSEIVASLIYNDHRHGSTRPAGNGKSMWITRFGSLKIPKLITWNDGMCLVCRPGCHCKVIYSLAKYTLRGHKWHFLIETMPESSGVSSRWLRSVSDDTTGRRRDIRSCTTAGMPAAFFLYLMTGRCRFAQPPAGRFDASGIILLRDVFF